MAQSYNPAEIKNKAADMQSESAKLKALVNEMSSTVQAMGGVWQSPAQAEFAKKFSELESELMDFCGSINKFAERAIQHASAVEEIEIV